MSHSLSSAAAASIVHREVEFLLARCETLGVSRDAAKACLLTEVMSRAGNGKAVSWQSPVLPQAQLLEAARQAQAESRGDDWEHVSLAWLELRHGIRLGDVVRVEGWEGPREILVDRFVIDWGADEQMPLAEGRMVLQGPTTHLQRGKLLAVHQCALSSRVERVRPSKLLKQLFPERFDTTPARRIRSVPGATV